MVALVILSAGRGCILATATAGSAAMPPSAVRQLASLVAEVCDMDSNHLSVDVPFRLDSLPAFQDVVASAPDAAEAAAELERWGCGAAGLPLGLDVW